MKTQYNLDWREVASPYTVPELTNTYRIRALHSVIFAKPGSGFIVNMPGCNRLNYPFNMIKQIMIKCKLLVTLIPKMKKKNKKTKKLVTRTTKSPLYPKLSLDWTEETSPYAVRRTD